MKTMMIAQKPFRKNKCDKKIYRATLSFKHDQRREGFGALEHPTATTVVLPEMMPREELVKSMKDVVSHEFFHIVTPLTIHSKEIHYFDYNSPKNQNIYGCTKE
jgi:predicted metalloprotease with PDZ domain